VVPQTKFWASKKSKKGPYKNNLERYYTYKSSQLEIEINDTFSDINKPIFET
jgi:hypothetical protein